MGIGPVGHIRNTKEVLKMKREHIREMEELSRKRAKKLTKEFFDQYASKINEEIGAKCELDCRYFELELFENWSKKYHMLKCEQSATFAKEFANHVVKFFEFSRVCVHLKYANSTSKIMMRCL